MLHQSQHECIGHLLFSNKQTNSLQMLVKRKLQTFPQLIVEYGLSVDIIVRSEWNKSNKLTRVPQILFKTMKKWKEMLPKVCAAAQSKSHIVDIHHPGIKPTTAYFLRRVSPSTILCLVPTIKKAMCHTHASTTVKSMIKSGVKCQLIQHQCT